MKTPPVALRGSVWVADLRGLTGAEGDRRVSLGIREGATQIEVGMALARVIEARRIGSQVGAPLLPGMEDPGLLLRELVGQYQDNRDYETDGGASYVADCCRVIVADLGHLPVSAFVAPGGESVLRVWRDKLWGRKLSNKTCNNLLHAAMAILRWGRTGGRRITGELPDMPDPVRRGGVLCDPVFETWTESDFRTLRDHCFDEAIRTGGLAKTFPAKADQVDYIARRKLYLSIAFYTGMHTADLDRACGSWFSVDVGRYERHNTKSARCVSPCWFDMPAQLQADCQAELARLGRQAWRPDELIAGGIWKGSSRMLAKATRRLFPDKSRPDFTFRIARRSMVREYTLRGWRTEEVAAILGHVDTQMIGRIYRRMNELHLIAKVRTPWGIASGPDGAPTGTGKILAFKSA